MNLWQILLLVFVVYLVTSILWLYKYPPLKKEIDQTTAKNLQIYTSPNKRPYFSIHYFSSGWDQAKKSLPQFILFVILSPLIFLAWLTWVLFGKDKPDDFERTYPPPHSGGRPKGGAYEPDAEAVRMIFEDQLDFVSVFEKLRPQYFTEKEWDGLHDDYQRKKAFDVWKRRIKRRMENNQ